MFHAANIYLAHKLSQSTARVKVLKPEKEEDLDVTVDQHQELVDSFGGATMKWNLSSNPNFTPAYSTSGFTVGLQPSEIRFFELTFHKKHRELVLGSYLPHILAAAKSIREVKKTVKLYAIDYRGDHEHWGAVNFHHPATFETVAMDPELKKALIADLDAFIERKDFYRKVGKAWKRGYLLYGPPGTGKSSLVAAMANYLKFDVYDLNLKEVYGDSHLHKLLIGAGNRSILVMEDFDRALASKKNEDEISMAGLLNFLDGLWSSCVEEKILVFTTNHKEELDPALLLPGRVDVQVNMSYCTFTAFKTLAYNYLKETEHELFGEIKELLRKVEATPAEVAGELLKSKNVDVALHGVVKLLRSKEGTRSIWELGFRMNTQSQSTVENQRKRE
ncbi:unnamed protein product [Linum trigynum]|uniref:AAA+ ATPase domain-containing protein n=1 Tax=Linum trigynum TaxID=586398 RepID=A0AAV2EED5_9ROSI